MDKYRKGTLEFAKLNAKKASEHDRNNYFHVYKNKESGNYYFTRYYEGYESIECYRKGSVYLG